MDPVLQLLEEYYPGSKQRRKALAEAPKHKLREDTQETWYASPFMKTLGGVETEMFTIGSLAKALGRPIATLRLWMKRGYLPSSPYRLKSSVVSGKVVPGRRLYTRPMIEGAVEAFTSRGLLNRARIDWQNHSDLTLDITASWQLKR